MKHEISQGEYAAFLNMLTIAQAAQRYPTVTDFTNANPANVYPTAFRYTITNTAPGVYLATAPSRACNWLHWDDAAAFLDWAALRPLSELEYEKACRGPAAPVPGEYAWGSTVIVSITGFSGLDGSGAETAVPADANTYFSRDYPAQTLLNPPFVGGPIGPVRCGIFGGNATRELQGSSYYGILDLSGNLIEMCVTIGHAAGRAYTGAHGDGTLSAAGQADVTNWPRMNGGMVLNNPGYNCDGFGFRGGDFYTPDWRLRTSVRSDATVSGKRRLFGLSFRGARTDPAPLPEPRLAAALFPLLLVCRMAYICVPHRRRAAM